MKPFFVYLLRCADSSYYCGQTDDIEQRLAQHGAGNTGYTATRKPVTLVWQGEFETRESAIAFEQQLKGWSRAKKEALIAGDWAQVQELARAKVFAPAPSPVTPSTACSVRPELVEGSLGLRQAQPERHALALRQAQGERGMGQAQGGERTRERTGEQGAGLETAEQALFEAILHGTAPVQRRGMAKTITLLESTRADHRARADALLTALLPHTGRSFRLGISGVPGVGKSTFIEALGLHLIGLGHKVAVLAVDPSSSVSGGSILGDKTRMEQLSVHPSAYIRPSPSSGTLGGVAEKTREAMLVCEAAGYDVVIVETVGVGQSETAVQGMTDMYTLLQLPNAGDDLQAIKKGVMELADLVVINKADIDPHAATRAQAQIVSSLRLLGMHGNLGMPTGERWQPQVMQISALKNDGVDRFWAQVSHFQQLQSANGRLLGRRQQQSLAWMWDTIHAELRLRFAHHPAVRAALADTTEQVRCGHLAASTAARQLLGLSSAA